MAFEEASKRNLVRAQAAEREVDALREALRKQEYDLAHMTLKADAERVARDNWRGLARDALAHLQNFVETFGRSCERGEGVCEQVNDGAGLCRYCSVIVPARILLERAA